MNIYEIKQTALSNINLAVELVYDAMLENDFFSLVEIEDNKEFARALAASIDDKHIDIPLGRNARLELIQNWLFMVEEAQNLQNHQFILAWLKEMEESNGNDYMVLSHMATYYNTMGYNKCALEYVRRIEKNGNLIPDVCKSLRAHAYIELGREQELQKLFSSFDEDDEDNFSLLCLGAWYCRYKGNYEEAIRLARKALNVIPDDAWALFEMGANLFFGGYCSEAERYFNILIDMSSRDTTAHYYSAFIWHYLGNNEAAIKTVGEIMQRNGSNASAYYTAAEIYALLGDFDLAEDCLAIAYEKGETKTGSIYLDCAFRDYFKERGSDFVEQYAVVIRAHDELEYSKIKGRHNGSIDAVSVNGSVYQAFFRIGLSTTLGYISTTTPSIVGSSQAVRANLTTDEELDNMLAAKMIYNPLLGTMDRVCVVTCPSQNFKHGTSSHYCIEGDICIARGLESSNGLIIGFDQLHKLSTFELKNGLNKTTSGVKGTIGFHFTQGIYTVCATIHGNTGYNSESVNSNLIIDTMLNTSYISRDEYNLMNEDGAFPLKKQRL